MKAATCRLCGRGPLAMVLDVGLQPLGNRFLPAPKGDEYLHPQALVQCPACGTVQLEDPPPAAELRPRFDWITYHEPEGHLDKVAETLLSLPGLGPGAVAAGTSYKDDTLLARLAGLGFRPAWRLEPGADLGLDCPRAEIEAVQDRLTRERAGVIAERRPRPDLLLARHVLEHAHDTRAFAGALAELVKPGGWLVFEVPDCSRAFDSLDYTTIWEEHVLYFTHETFRRCFARLGFGLHRFDCHPYAFEDALVAFVRAGGAAEAALPPAEVLEREVARAAAFGRGYPGRRESLRDRLRLFRDKEGKIAILGAGHLAVTYINLMNLSGLIEFAVDDNPLKKGLCLPGSRLPIVGSGRLLEDGIRLCLLSVAAESEEKVVRNNRAFVEAGGKFASISPHSPRRLAV